MDYKGNINTNYDKSFFEARQSFINYENFTNEFYPLLKNKDSYLEMSHVFSPAFFSAVKDFKEGYFLSDNSFEAFLTYHFSKIENKNVNVYNTAFNITQIEKLKFNEKFDFIFSLFGLSFESLYNLLPVMIGLAKVDGIIAIELPAYWFFRENISDVEKAILAYSKQNDKKWLFTEPLVPIIEENKAEFVFLKETGRTKKVDRLELAFLSSLHKLYNAQIENNIAVLEIVNFPEKDILLKTAVLAIRKKSKTVTKDNLFSF
jgi:hypothetical protein